jgi:hypothetical protein
MDSCRPSVGLAPLTRISPHWWAVPTLPARLEHQTKKDAKTITVSASLVKSKSWSLCAKACHSRANLRRYFRTLIRMFFQATSYGPVPALMP